MNKKNRDSLTFNILKNWGFGDIRIDEENLQFCQWLFQFMIVNPVLITIYITTIDIDLLFSITVCVIACHYVSVYVVLSSPVPLLYVVFNVLYVQETIKAFEFEFIKLIKQLTLKLCVLAKGAT